MTPMLLPSEISVLKPLLAFQHAKLTFEATLFASDLTYSIVRAMAFYKSLSGQVDRVRQSGWGMPLFERGSFGIAW